MKDCRLSNIVLFSQPSRAKRKTDSPQLGWEDVINKDLKGMRASWEGVQREALFRPGLRSNVRSYWPQEVWFCGELLVVVVVALNIINILINKY